MSNTEKVEEMLQATKRIRAELQDLDGAQQLAVVTKLLFELGARNGWSKERTLECAGRAIDALTRLTRLDS